MSRMRQLVRVSEDKSSKKRVPNVFSYPAHYIVGVLASAVDFPQALGDSLTPLCNLGSFEVRKHEVKFLEKLGGLPHVSHCVKTSLVYT